MPLVVEWVNRWTFSSPPPSPSPPPSFSPPPSSSSPPPSSHHQLFVYLRYRKRCGGGHGSFAVM